MTAPQVWNVYVEGNAEIQMEVGFEEFLIQIGEHTKKDVNKLNVFEFYTLVKYLKSKNGNN
jgi:UDP-N-acetylglucosamine transferase subunit ALG13